MSIGKPKDPTVPPGTSGRTLTRRKFLTSLGILAGAGAAAPLLRGFPSHFSSSSETFEAGRPALGTWVRISVHNSDPQRARRAVERAFAAIRRVDEQMSVHRADSQLFRTNAAAGRSAVAVDPAVIDVISIAKDAARRSEGVYDPTILPLMRLYGFYDSGKCRYPTDREIAAALDATGWDRVRVDPAAGTVALARAGMALDLGSIGKGWALDRAVDALKAEGIQTALVDIGGNIHGLGAPLRSPEGWNVGVTHPVTGRLVRTFVLKDTSVATSGNAEQSRVLGGVRVGHLFDARRGRPANGHLSASVQARTGVESDYLSTVAYLLGPDRFHGWPEAMSAHFAG